MLFSQLFGDDDPDEDVSPDTADPEAAGEWMVISTSCLSCLQSNITSNVLSKVAKLII
jgi:ubiquitin-like 1-activating enzyme E1 B